MPNHNTSRFIDLFRVFHPPRSVMLRTAAVLAALPAWPTNAAAGSDARQALPDATAPASPPRAYSTAVAGVPGRGGQKWKEVTWPVGSVLHVVFMDSPPGETDLRKKVMKDANTWTRHANIKFEFHASMEKFAADHPGKIPQVRISLAQGLDNSDIGNLARKTPLDEATMRLGTVREKLTQGDTAGARRVVLHEFGHALGRRHEHQNPVAGIQWNAPYVLRHRCNDEDQCRRNILESKEDARSPDGGFDPHSIMNYAVSEKETIDGYSIAESFDLSPLDIARARMMYPFPGDELPPPHANTFIDDGLVWFPGSTAPPDGAVSVGMALKEKEYVCRSVSRSPQVPFIVGMTDDVICIGAFDGRAETATEYEILSAPGHQWAPATRSMVPDDALMVAIADGVRTPLCRIRVGDRHVVGWVSGGDCMVAEGTALRRAKTSFDVLLPPTTKPPLALWLEPDAVRAHRSGAASPAACRAWFDGSIHLGRVVDDTCLVGAYVRGNPIYQILASTNDAAWVPASTDHLPQQIPTFGRVMVQGTEQPVGLCRVIEGDRTFFGQLGSDHRCRYDREGKNTTMEPFDVLVDARPVFPMDPVSSADPGGWVSPSGVSHSDQPRLCRVPHGSTFFPGWVDGQSCRYLVHDTDDMEETWSLSHGTFQVLDLPAAYQWVAAESALLESAVRVGRGNDDGIVCRASVIKDEDSEILAIGAVYGQECHVGTQEGWWGAEKFEVAVPQAN